MTALPYRLVGPIGSRATLGLIVLQTDETVEQDFRRLFTAPDVALYVTRVPSGAEVTPETLGAMEAALTSAAALFPPAATFDAVGYGCTSGSAVIGPARVASLVTAGARTGHVTNPLDALRAALAALGVRAVGLVSPYIDSVSTPLRAALAAGGTAVPDCVSFGEADEASVARIDPASIRAAALEVGSRAGVDAVILSCTNLRTLDIIDGLERDLGKPVISSNQALAWHMAGLAGGLPLTGAPGRLFGHRVPAPAGPGAA